MTRVAGLKAFPPRVRLVEGIMPRCPGAALGTAMVMCQR
jgi:hypothetical protein